VTKGHTGLDVSVAPRVISSLARHPAIVSVNLTGSRARSEATELSDWDFNVQTGDFRSVADALPELVAPLEPIAQQWDRLSDHACYMLLLRDLGKVDLIFDEPWESKPPWEVSAETLRGIDDHFWDWTIWLAAKDRAGKQELVRSELEKMHGHLLEPLGVGAVPSSIRDAVGAYTAAREEAEGRLGIIVARTVEDEVRGLLLAGGYAL
jgi:hypothetical protein